MAFATNPKYLFLDEIFDGLDPVIRNTLKTLIIEDVTDREMTCIIASHNLREIDDICDKIVLLHKGTLVTNEETDELKSQMHKNTACLLISQLTEKCLDKLGLT